MKNINMIVAVDLCNGIGKDNKLLYHSKEDLKYFKSITEGHTVVMGYNTYISLPTKPLCNRRNIVITLKNISLEGCEVIHNIQDLFSIINKDEQVFICGGASIYNQFMQYIDKLYITRIFKKFQADTFFPKIKKSEWILEKSERINGNPNLEFNLYSRKISKKVSNYKFNNNKINELIEKNLLRSNFLNLNVFSIIKDDTIENKYLNLEIILWSDGSISFKDILNIDKCSGEFSNNRITGIGTKMYYQDIKECIDLFYIKYNSILEQIIEK